MAQTIPEKKRTEKIVSALRSMYPRAKTALEFRTPVQMLVSTILSAQCTDKRVNEVTKTLFTKYKTAADFAAAPLKNLEEEIRPTGFFRNKSKNIKSCCEVISREYGGEVPREMEQLTQLPGVGRKTANCVRSNAFGLPGITVDTHVMRVSQRLGFTKNNDPVKIEFDLREIFPEKDWTFISHAIIDHGRAVCTARSPKCPQCRLLPFCPYGRENVARA